jgi:hypothetical protein
MQLTDQEKEKLKAMIDLRHFRVIQRYSSIFAYNMVKLYFLTRQRHIVGLLVWNTLRFSRSCVQY